MSRMIRQTQLAILSSALLFGACGDQAAQAQNNAGTRAQIREGLGNAPATIDTTTAVRLSAAFRGAAEQVLPSVVHIRVTTTQTARTRAPQRSFPFPFFDDGDPQQPRRGMGTGSGFVFDPRGYILTNNHVVENADRVLVTFVDGREYMAQVVGSDPQTDVGVIKIEPKDGETFNAVTFGSSDQTHVGDWVIAIGNPLTLQFSVTAGIVSAKGRNLGILDREVAQQGTALESFIQTDAAINPGNSGGPLIDLRGRVVGINSAIESPTGYFAGAGFAIPIDLARKVARDIIEFGHVRRPRLGVEVRGVTAADAQAFKLPAVSGAVMASVQPGLPADRAGIEMGDVVIGLNGNAIRTQTQFMEELARLRPGDRVTLDIIRYGQRLRKTVELGEFESAAPRATQNAQRPRTEELLGFSAVQITPQLAQRIGLASNTSGVVVHEVDPFSPAAGYVGPGTQILSINGREVRTVQDVERIAEGLRPGQVVSLVVRSGDTQPRIVNYSVR